MSKSGSPQYTRKYEIKLIKRQRELSKKAKGSKNRVKAKLKVAKIHTKISYSRNDFNNKITINLIRENQAIADSACGDFFRKLKYKV